MIRATSTTEAQETPLFGLGLIEGVPDSLACDPIPGVDDDMEDLILFTDFMTFLARVAPAASHPAGSRVFNRIGCNDCHTRTLTTGANANPALDRATFHPFSDFLLHDMGILDDGVAQGDAGPTEDADGAALGPALHVELPARRPRAVHRGGYPGARRRGRAGAFAIHPPEEQGSCGAAALF